MTWKWTLLEANMNFWFYSRKYHKECFELSELLKDYSNDYDYVVWNGKRQMVCEAQASINNYLVANCKNIVSQLSWEDQITFVMEHVRDQPYLLYCLDDVQRSVMVLIS